VLFYRNPGKIKIYQIHRQGAKETWDKLKAVNPKWHYRGTEKSSKATEKIRRAFGTLFFVVIPAQAGIQVSLFNQNKTFIWIPDQVRDDDQFPPLEKGVGGFAGTSKRYVCKLTHVSGSVKKWSDLLLGGLGFSGSKILYMEQVEQAPGRSWRVSDKPVWNNSEPGRTWREPVPAS
jgi:hypothetical protein